MRVYLGLLECVAHQYWSKVNSFTLALQKVLNYLVLVYECEHTAIMMVIVILCGGFADVPFTERLMAFCYI